LGIDIEKPRSNDTNYKATYRPKISKWSNKTSGLKRIETKQEIDKNKLWVSRLQR
jgi:hypothetical protein